MTKDKEQQTMSELARKIMAILAKPGYQPVKPKVLARKIGPEAVEDYAGFRKVLKQMVNEGRAQLGRNHTIRPAPAAAAKNLIPGIFRKAGGGFGFVRPTAETGQPPPPDIYIPEESVGDAVTGDVVLIRIRQKAKRSDRGPKGEIVRVLERTRSSFVGTYFERDGKGHVRVDGTVFAHSIFVGDPGAKGARPEDKVVLEMIRFPSPEDRGEGVIVEVLGQRGQPGVDVLSVIRALGIPDVFAEDALEEARQEAARFDEKNLDGREDLTGATTITIDPVDARDFDDAISLTVDPKSKHWQIAVHIADVGHFAQPGGALDREARRRGTSVYLPRHVVPMFPEVLSNGLASLQEGRVRFVKSVFIDMTPTGQKAHVRFANAAIRVTKRFAYEQVTELLEKGPTAAVPDPGHDILAMLRKMRELATLLQQRRVKRGALELHMPEAQLEYDDNGRVSGAHFRKHDISHVIVEEFMLLANEAVASYLDQKGLAFLRRVHPAPDPAKLKHFGEFARSLGYKLKSETDRFALQRVLQQSAQRPEVYAVHYALLRSLKQATYSPEKDDHYALASENYCHFTSPIRRYPDLTVHRLLDRVLRRGKVGSDFEELVTLGQHCSKTERRAEMAERELVKMKLLHYMSERLGLELDAIVTGVADYGFYAQPADLPIEGLVHISTLPDDYYYFDDATHSLIGQRNKRRFRLGDRVHVKVVRVDEQRRQLDFRVLGPAKATPSSDQEGSAEEPEASAPGGRPRRGKRTR